MSRGLEIIKALRGYCSGLEIPEYVIDLPNGLGKVPVSEGVSTDNGQWQFTNWSGTKICIDESEFYQD